MKKLITLLALIAIAGIASAQTVTNLFPNGDFSAGGPTADWVEVNGGGGFIYTYPATGGNPGGYGVIDATTAGSSWGIWVGGDSTPLPLDTLGLVPGTSYKFVQDMKTLVGTNTGGVKIESWGPSGKISDSGDMRPGSWSTSWATYTFNYTIAFGATGIKVVPLWGQYSSVAYDNLGVVVATSSPLSAEITNPSNGAQVGKNFIIVANASVVPGAITSVDFYRGTDLLGTDYDAPFSWNVVDAATGPAALKVVAHDDNGGSIDSAVVNVTVSDVVIQTIVKVDPSKPWQGYMNVFQTPQNFGGPAFQSAWGVADLSAAFSGVGPASVLTLKPAGINDTNSYWYDYSVEPLLSDPAHLSDAVGFKDMEANMYVQVADGTLSGNLVTFMGTCVTNSLVSPSSTNGIGNGWTSYAFIKDFAPNYSSFVVTNVALTSGVPFSISLQADPDPTRHIQYGFVTRGPNVWPTDVNKYGSVVIQSLDATPTNVYVNSSSPWTGYMNVFSQDGIAYQFGSGWGTADLTAVFNGFGLVLGPNTIGDSNSYWYVGGGAPGAVGNKTMDASMYIEIGSLPGRKLVFSGNVLSNTLVSASNTNAAGHGWTSVAFIKDFAPDYSSFNSATVPLTPGAFSINLDTVNDPARHVQYGFETVGPNVWVTDVAPFGNVVIGNVGVLPTAITPSLSGGNIKLSFNTQLGKAYTVQYKNELTDVLWNTITTTNGTGVAAVVSEPAGGDHRFYRLSVQ